MSYEKVVCTGGAGVLGSVFVDQMKDRAQVRVVDTKAPAPGVDYVEASILDYAALKQAFTGADAVVHLAAVSNPRITSQETTFHVNVQGTWAVLQAAEDAGVKRVVVASSDATTGLLYNPPGWAPQFLPIDETHPLRPIEAYSLSKEVTEAIARSYANRGKLDVLVIRPTHIMFPDEYPVIRQKGADVSNYHLWTYVSPQDVSQGFRLALEAKGVRHDTFFITAADGLNERPTLELLRERYGTVPPLRDADRFEKLPTASIFSTRHAQDVLGYQPTSNWRDMVASIGA